MSELEDKINSVLSDPAQMERISSLAKTLMAGSQPGGGAPEGDSLGGIARLAKSLMGDEGGGDIDPATLTRISRILSAGGENNSEKRALLAAMKPYLSEKRRAKMDKAMKIAKLAKMAQFAIGEMGGENGD